MLVNMYSKYIRLCKTHEDILENGAALLSVSYNQPLYRKQHATEINKYKN